MQTRHFPVHPARAFSMLLAIPAAAGLMSLAGGTGVAAATTSGATRAASGLAAIAAGTPTSATAITLSHRRSVLVSRTATRQAEHAR